jgi:peptidoglycan/LPS O-acetylase OafA/YrhL
MVVFKAVRQICQLAGVFDLTRSGKLIYLGAAYGGTFLMAALTYRLVEQPLRRRGREYAKRYLERTAQVDYVGGRPGQSIEISMP